MRPLLTVLCARMLGYRNGNIYDLAASMEMLHAATLLHDDVLDNAVSRRGQAAAHTVFGITGAILAGDALLAAGNAIVASFGLPSLSLCYSHATSQTAAGEIMEMNALGSPNLVLAQYLEIARGKTACLISQACAMGAVVAGASDARVSACAAYGENLGVAFQIVDDVLDFAPESQTGKPSGGDLRERKMTPPLMLYRDSLADAARADFDRNFAAGSFSENDLNLISRTVHDKFAAMAIELAASHIQKARDSLAELPDGEEKPVLLEMCAYVLSRTK